MTLAVKFQSPEVF